MNAERRYQDPNCQIFCTQYFCVLYFDIFVGKPHVMQRAVLFALGDLRVHRLQYDRTRTCASTKSRNSSDERRSTGNSRRLQKCNIKHPLARLQTDAVKTRLKFRSIVEKVNYTERGVLGTPTHKMKKSHGRQHRRASLKKSEWGAIRTAPSNSGFPLQRREAARTQTGRG